MAAAPDGPIAVIATEGTVKGGAYVRAIQDIAPQMPVVQQACPLFVALAEEGLRDGQIAELAAHRYLDPLLATMPQAARAGAGLHPFSRAERDHRQSGRAGRGAGGQRRDHGGGGGENSARAESADMTARRSRRAFWPPMRRAASPIWARFSWASRSIPARVTLVDL